MAVSDDRKVHCTAAERACLIVADFSGFLRVSGSFGILERAARSAARFDARQMGIGLAAELRLLHCRLDMAGSVAQF
jgi:hypothetical protein